ncbi:MAG TPA: hypothetical protein VKR41_07760 [Puia sp.]|nr:hypothetical protein [Puia sp.]
MKNLFLSFLSLLFSISSIYAQTQLTKVTPAGHTSIRSVVAQGGELRMLVHVGEAGAYQFNIYSMDGEIVYQETLQVQAGEVGQKIQFCGRVHGVYEVNLSGAGGQSTRQLIW